METVIFPAIVSYTPTEVNNMEHGIILENRENLTVTAVTDVKNFDDESVDILLEEGGLDVKGRNLKIVQIDLDEGRAVLSGRIDSMVYTKKRAGSGGIFRRLKNGLFGRRNK